MRENSGITASYVIRLNGLVEVSSDFLLFLQALFDSEIAFLKQILRFLDLPVVFLRIESGIDHFDSRFISFFCSGNVAFLHSSTGDSQCASDITGGTSGFKTGSRCFSSHFFRQG
ncbi:MAG TPA: hypothetical protein PK671_22715, partial [Candidatus Obscuribacter sp.]|nr:hypothetical protein [Candidatus Obscuribacter sp.]